MSSGSFPPVQKSKVKNFINNQKDIINSLIIPDPYSPFGSPPKVPHPPPPPHSQLLPDTLTLTKTSHLLCNQICFALKCSALPSAQMMRGRSRDLPDFPLLQET